MEIQELKVLLTIYEEGGFLRAAKKLHLTQPAVSQSLKNLERKIGELLVIRANPIQLTPIGMELLKHAKSVVGSELNFQSQLARFKRGFLQKFDIAMDHLMAHYFAVDLVRNLHQSLPEAQIRLNRLPAREIVHAVKARQMAIGVGPFQSNMDGLFKLKLMQERSFLVAGKKNPYLSHYKDDPLRFLRKSVLLSSWLDNPTARPSKKKIRDYFQDVWEINDIALQMQLVKEGVGTTFLARTFLDADRYRKHLVVLEKLPFSLIAKDYGIYMHKDEANSNSAVVDILINSLPSQSSE